MAFLHMVIQGSRLIPTCASRNHQGLEVICTKPAAKERLSLKTDMTSIHIPLAKTSLVVTPNYKGGWELRSSWESRKGRKGIFGE